MVRGIRLRAGTERAPSPAKAARISNSSINDGVGLGKRYRRWLELKWLTPSKLVPHGAAGIVTLTLGLSLCALPTPGRSTPHAHTHARPPSLTFPSLQPFALF